MKEKIFHFMDLDTKQETNIIACGRNIRIFRSNEHWTTNINKVNCKYCLNKLNYKSVIKDSITKPKNIMEKLIINCQKHINAIERRIVWLEKSQFQEEARILKVKLSGINEIYDIIREYNQKSKPLDQFYTITGTNW